MIKKLCRWILYKRGEWKTDVSVSLPDKCIICLAPHTSNWDLIMGQLYMRAEGLHIGFLMKKEWFFWPLGYFWKSIGGIPVWRSCHTSLTDNLAQECRQRKYFRLCITPEGTRSYNPDWKKGFYFIALKAQIPILLYGLDYKLRLIQCTESFIPGGDVESDMRKIKVYFKKFQGLHPENFTIGDINE